MLIRNIQESKISWVRNFRERCAILISKFVNSWNEKYRIPRSGVPFQMTNHCDSIPVESETEMCRDKNARCTLMRITCVLSTRVKSISNIGTSIIKSNNTDVLLYYTIMTKGKGNVNKVWTKKLQSLYTSESNPPSLRHLRGQEIHPTWESFLNCFRCWILPPQTENQ